MFWPLYIFDTTLISIHYHIFFFSCRRLSTADYVAKPSSLIWLTKDIPKLLWTLFMIIKQDSSSQWPVGIFKLVTDLEIRTWDDSCPLRQFTPVFLCLYQITYFPPFLRTAILSFLPAIFSFFPISIFHLIILSCVLLYDFRVSSGRYERGTRPRWRCLETAGCRSITPRYI